MKTLREEIKDIIIRTREITEVNTSNYITHLIITSIEKRIDSLAKEYQKNDRFMIGFDELKKEMLSK